MHAYAKSGFSHDMGICCISIFLAKQIYLLAKRKKQTTGPDKSVIFKKKL